MARRTSGVSVKLAALVMRGLNLQIGYFVAHMAGTTKNPNMTRRLGPGLLMGIAASLLKPWLWLLRKNPTTVPKNLTVFQSYLVGDLFMALPALKVLANSCEIQVLCRPDCTQILSDEGLQGIPFDNGFFIQPGFFSFFRTLRSAWKLRGEIGTSALDFDADPRTAFWLKIAGATRVVSYSRSFAFLFDDLFPIPDEAIHQADKNMAVTSGFLTRHHATGNMKPARTKNPPFIGLHPPSTETWLISCWTRKDTKNWPLDRWDEFLRRMQETRIPFRILNAPDGGAAFQEFHARWTGRVPFLEGSLREVADAVLASTGIVATDNFIGHMAGYYSKPVLWINGSSDPFQVSPRGPKTRIVQVNPMNCRPCNHRCVNPEYKACLLHLEVNDVWHAFETLRPNGINPGDAPSA